VKDGTFRGSLLNSAGVYGDPRTQGSVGTRSGRKKKDRPCGCSPRKDRRSGCRKVEGKAEWSSTGHEEEEAKGADPFLLWGGARGGGGGKNWGKV